MDYRRYCPEKLFFNSLFLQQAAFGGNTAPGNGPSFADVLASSYGLTLNEYGGGGDDSMGGSGGEGGGVAPPPHHMDHHHHCANVGGGGGGHSPFHNHGRRNPSGGGAYHQGGGESGSSPFSDPLDTFHAEFITQPIDYPLGGVTPPPPPLMQLHSTASSSTGSPVGGGAAPPHPPPPPLSPSLPSFLDTYSVARHLHEMSPQPTTLEQRFNFKPEPPGTPTSPAGTPSSPFVITSAGATAVCSR
jgi:hypothetical protein